MQEYMYCTYSSTTAVAIHAKAPEPKFAKPGANPTLETIEYVRAALRGAQGPISRNRLLAVLSRWGHSTTRQSLNVVLAFLGDAGMVAEGSKGLIWVPEATGPLLEAIRKGTRGSPGRR